MNCVKLHFSSVQLELFRDTRDKFQDAKMQ